MGSGKDDLRQVRNGRRSWDDQSVAEIVPEGNAELRTGFGEPEKGIVAIAPGVAAGSAADLSPGDLAADVIFRSVGVQRDLRAIEDEEQFGLVGVEAGEQAAEGEEFGAALENAIETGTQGGPALG